MLSATIKSLLRELLDAGRRANLALASLAAERRCALRLDRVGDRLDMLCERINLLRSRMRDDAGEAVDTDHALREALKALKAEVREIRCQLAAMHTPQLGARLQRAFGRLARIAEQTYACADQLQWEINELDARFS
jgi:hypothetical protein